MNRREALLQLVGAAGSSLTCPWIDAALAGAPMHEAPAQSQLTAAQRAMVTELAELVIPRTDTPGAIDAGVPQFIDHIVSDWYTQGERAIFLAGLSELEVYSQKQYGRGFIECSHAERNAALERAEVQAGSYRPTPGVGILASLDEHSPFFFKLKQLTVVGYYTSQVGATEELAYNPVPGRFDGDYDFAEIGRQWSS